ncbi:TPA: ribosomal RNA small subunit methyltransferase A [Candidatus Acetothermia bacterium]|nr:ribosomal RNA small subunit methyltransferase A [Candidatus Acetothermia bacterium]
MKGESERPWAPLVRPRELAGLLSRHGIRLRPSLGQHFLVDENILLKIVEAARETRASHALEVGAGVGTLTLALAPHLRRLWAVELDSRLIPLLEERVSSFPQVEVLQADFLRLPLADFGQGLLVVGNLPYGITSQVLLKLIRERGCVAWGVFMVQREVGEKLVAPPGRGASRLGLHLQAYFGLELLRKVPRTVFFPPPEVDSVLLRLRRLASPRISSPEPAFERVLALLFSGRRKTIRRALGAVLPLGEVDRLLLELGIDPRRRGETLAVEEVDRLASRLADRLP